MSSIMKNCLPLSGRGVKQFSPGPSVSSTNKTDHHDIVEILLKVALNTINQQNGKEGHVIQLPYHHGYEGPSCFYVVPIKLMVALTEKHFHEIFKVKNSNNPFKIGVIEML
jgi:hypothetical protein